MLLLEWRSDVPFDSVVPTIVLLGGGDDLQVRSNGERNNFTICISDLHSSDIDSHTYLYNNWLKNQNKLTHAFLFRE
jgi:hypothetical protein